MLVTPFERQVAIQQPLDVFVGHPFFRMDDALVKRVVEHLAGAGEVHDDAQCETIDPGIQRAEMIRNFFRQHRQNPVGEINGRSAVSRFKVHCRVQWNKMRDVGDVNAELVGSVRKDLHIDGIVEVASSLRIDC